MRASHFWTLIVISAVASLCMLQEFILSHAIIHENHVLVDSHETAGTDTTYKEQWQRLALSVYRASRQDPAMAALLQNEGVTVHEGLPPGTAPSGVAPEPTPVPSSKPVQQQALHPGTP